MHSGMKRSAKTDYEIKTNNKIIGTGNVQKKATHTEGLECQEFFGRKANAIINTISRFQGDGDWIKIELRPDLVYSAE